MQWRVSLNGYVIGLIAYCHFAFGHGQKLSEIEKPEDNKRRPNQYSAVPWFLKSSTQTIYLATTGDIWIDFMIGRVKKITYSSVMSLPNNGKYFMNSLAIDYGNNKESLP